MGVAMSVGYFPQAYKIWKVKSSKTISIPAFVTFSIGTFTWFIYGLMIHDLPIISGFGIGVLGSWSVLSLSLLYKNNL